MNLAFGRATWRNVGGGFGSRTCGRRRGGRVDRVFRWVQLRSNRRNCLNIAVIELLPEGKTDGAIPAGLRHPGEAQYLAVLAAGLAVDIWETPLGDAVGGIIAAARSQLVKSRMKSASSGEIREDYFD